MKWGKTNILRCFSKVQGVFAAVMLGGMIFTGVERTVAYLTTSFRVTNIFTVGTTDLEIVEENFTGYLKSGVSIKNSGNIPVYVRAKEVVYWEDEHGNVLLEQPLRAASEDAQGDYWMTGAVDGGAEHWQKGKDGFYYHMEPLMPGESTADLIDYCIDKKTYNDGRTLVVDVAAQSIQAALTDVVEMAWGVMVHPKTGNLILQTLYMDL